MYNLTDAYTHTHRCTQKNIKTNAAGAVIPVRDTDVSTLLTKITSNGYKILYLTNRPLPDWHAKKSGADGALPRGPVLCPPEVLFRSTFSSKDRHSHQEASEHSR